MVKVALKDDDFNDDFLDCVYHLLQSKKEVSQADKIMKFISLFVSTIKDIKSPESDQVQLFLGGLLFQRLLKGAVAGNKTVRFRSCQLLSVLMNSLDEIK